MVRQRHLQLQNARRPRPQSRRPYGVPLMTHGDMKFAARDTFLISPDGKIVKVWEKVNPNVHSEEVLAEITANKK